MPKPKTFFCSICKEDKPCSEFYKDNATTRGYQYYCKSCTKDIVAAQKKKRREEAHKLIRVRIERKTAMQLYTPAPEPYTNLLIEEQTDEIEQYFENKFAF